jgi:hypothetical protein
MSEWPDVEGAVRDWLRADPGVSAFVGSRVFFGVPRNARDPQSFPLVTVARVGGAADPNEAPVDLALLSIECWGSIDPSGNGDKAEATAVVNAVRSALEGINGRTALSGFVDAFGVAEAGVVFAPDPDNDRPRYVLTAEVTAMATNS